MNESETATLPAPGAITQSERARALAEQIEGRSLQITWEELKAARDDDSPTA